MLLSLYVYEYILYIMMIWFIWTLYWFQNRRLYYSLHSHGNVARSSTQLIDHYFIFFFICRQHGIYAVEILPDFRRKWKKNAADRDMDIFGLCTDGVYSVWWRQNTSPGKHSSAWFSNFLQKSGLGETFAASWWRILENFENLRVRGYNDCTDRGNIMGLYWQDRVYTYNPDLWVGSQF